MSATMTYNDVAFTALYKSHVSSKPIHDDAMRTVVGVAHTILVDAYITASGANTGATMEGLRKRLTTQAGELTYTDLGFGTLHVNGSSAVKDARWGPIPELLDFTPMGGNGIAARVQFRVTTIIPECDNAVYEKGLMALNYSVTHVIDESGYTTASISGYLEIPMTRKNGSRTPPDCVDAYRERLEARPASPGFQRTRQTYQISADRRRLDFSWSDVELNLGYFPNGVSVITAEQTIRPQTKWLAKMWTLTLSATITMAKGAEKRESLRIFLLLLANRDPKQTGGSTVIRQTIEVRDSIFGRETSFTATLRIMDQFPLGEVLERTRMWNGVEGSPERWAASLLPFGTQGVRGNRGLKYTAAEDAIIDLCDPTAKVPAPSTSARKSQAGRTIQTQGKPAKADPRQSWISYWCFFRWLERSNNVPHKPLPPNPVEPTKIPGAGNGGTLRPFDNSNTPSGAGDPPFGTLRAFPESKPLSVAPFSNASADANDAEGGPSAAQGRGPLFPPDLVQKAAGASRLISLEGIAFRVGFQIPPPKLVTVGGVNVVEMDRDVATGVVAQTDAGPIFCTRWVITYLVPDAPEGILPVPANPWLDTDSTSKSA